MVGLFHAEAIVLMVEFIPLIIMLKIFAPKIVLTPFVYDCPNTFVVVFVVLESKFERNVVEIFQISLLYGSVLLNKSLTFFFNLEPKRDLFGDIVIVQVHGCG